MRVALFLFIIARFEQWARGCQAHNFRYFSPAKLTGSATHSDAAHRKETRMCATRCIFSCLLRGHPPQPTFLDFFFLPWLTRTLLSRATRVTAASKPTKEKTGPAWDERWMRRVLSWDWPTIGLILGVKALVLTFGVQAVASMSMSHGVGSRSGITGTQRIISGWQSRLCGGGRQPVLASLFPLYPWLVRGVVFFLPIIWQRLWSFRGSLPLPRACCCDGWCFAMNPKRSRGMPFGSSLSSRRATFFISLTPRACF